MASLETLSGIGTGLGIVQSLAGILGKKKKQRSPEEIFNFAQKQQLRQDIDTYLRPEADRGYDPLVARAGQLALEDIQQAADTEQKNAKARWGRRGNVSMADGDSFRARLAGIAAGARQKVATDTAQADLKDQRRARLVDAMAALNGQTTGTAQLGMQARIYGDQSADAASTDLGTLFASWDTQSLIERTLAKAQAAGLNVSEQDVMEKINSRRPLSVAEWTAAGKVP